MDNRYADRKTYIRELIEEAGYEPPKEIGRWAGTNAIPSDRFSFDEKADWSRPAWMVFCQRRGFVLTPKRSSLGQQRETTYERDPELIALRAQIDEIIAAHPVASVAPETVTETAPAGDEDDRSDCVGFGYRDDDSRIAQRRANRVDWRATMAAAQVQWDANASESPWPCSREGGIAIIRMIAEAAGWEKA